MVVQLAGESLKEVLTMKQSVRFVLTLVLCFILSLSGVAIGVPAALGAAYAFTGRSGDLTGSANPATITMDADKSVTASSPQTSIQKPRWRILVLIYTSTDFTYNDSLGQHHIMAAMTRSEIDRADLAARKFTGTDIPALTSGYMIPLLTIRYPNHPLTALDSFGGYCPSRASTNADLDPSFDSVVVIWDDSGTDQITGQPAVLNEWGGLAAPNGTGQTFCTFPVDSVASNQRNVFKHEWGHSIVSYFEAAGASPDPAVDIHIDDTTNRYVHCPSGKPYVLQDETDDHPIPNSIYNNDSGFTHDYYSGTTAKPESPNTCLGLSQAVWSTGGPVTKPYVPVNVLLNGGFEDGGTTPDFWSQDAWIMSNSTFTWDSAEKHSGNRSVKISNDATNDARWVQTISVQPHARYRLSGWIKTQSVAQNGDRGANLSILDTYTSTNALYGTNDWTYVSVDCETGSRTNVQVAARLGMYSGDTIGTAWFDNLKFESLRTPARYTLRRNVDPSGSGAVTADPAPNYNGGTQYLDGTVVTLTAIPAAGYVLIGWSGALSGTKNPATVTMNADKNVTASFAARVKSVIQLKIGSRTMYVDGSLVVLEAAPIILNSRTLLPIRAVVEATGGTIVWNASAQKVTIMREGKTLDLWIGKNVAKLNGKSINIDSDSRVVPIIRSGRTLLPLRFVAEALALDVQWDATTQTITITYTP